MSEPETADLPEPARDTDVLWFLPTHGDGRTLTQAGATTQAAHQGAGAGEGSPAPTGARRATLAYCGRPATPARTPG